MAGMRPMTLPVTLRIGDTEAEIGHIDVPVTGTPGTAVRSSGNSVDLPIAVDLDGPELRRRIADFLREAATAFEEVTVDGDR